MTKPKMEETWLWSLVQEAFVWLQSFTDHERARLNQDGSLPAWLEKALAAEGKDDE